VKKEHFSVGRKVTKIFRHFEGEDQYRTSISTSKSQQSFEVEIDASGYTMCAILMQYCKPVCYHSETFNQVVVNYPTYDKELYALVQSINKWNNYLLGKETIIHTNHQPLHYLQA
jgi:hypothetical protein